LQQSEVLALFERAGAIAHGHFILSSGLHSPIFLRKNLVFMDPTATELLGAALGDRLRQLSDIDLVVTPAIGGMLPAYEVARRLGVQMIYFEKEKGRFALRRGFTIPPGARIALVEDVVTTGRLSKEIIETVTDLGGKVVCAGYVVDRSPDGFEIDVPKVSLMRFEAPAYRPDAVPEDLAALPAEVPGSNHTSAY
jgi:orotate phosphoribosyltransferase